MKYLKTFEPTNQFQFECPIFKATTKMASCLALRDMVWRGEGPKDKRQGCQCAMMSNKCPIPDYVKITVRTLDDSYYSAEPKVGKLDAELLDRTARTVVTDSMMRRYCLSSQEEKLLLQANEDARSGKYVMPRKPRKAERMVEMEDVKKAPPPPAPTDASELVKAAQSGDMGAAVNAEVARAQ